MNSIILPVEPAEKRLERAQRIAGFLGRLDTGKPWEVLVRPWKKSRSDRQNNAMFGVAYKTLSNFTGFTEPELHERFLRAFFGEIEYEVLGAKFIRPRRTTTTNERGERDVLSREDFSRFFSFIQQKAAEIGCYIEDPNPQLRTRAA
jgi:hypothetical protein